MCNAECAPTCPHDVRESLKMITPLTARAASISIQGDADLLRLASLQTNGASPSIVTERRAALGDVGMVAADPRRAWLAQNVANGGSAVGNGNIRFTSGPGSRVGTTAAHVLIHPNIGVTTRIPTRINVNGSETRTSIKEFFPDPTTVEIFKVIGSAGQGIDVVKLGRPADIKAHFEQLAIAQPTVNATKTALAAPQAKWQISTASQPRSYAPDEPVIEPLSKQSNWSETTPKFSFELTALPLQVKDLSADLKASGMGSITDKPDSWLALGAIGGDENNRSSPYKGLYLVNRGVSGSESKASGISAADNGTLIAGADVRDVGLGWTLGNVKTLVGKNAALRSALKVKFPALTTSEAAGKLYEQGFVKIAFITRDIAVSNLKTIDRTAR